ncbi:hypothetical protein HO173_012906 [Letharia columbiana]|uniref:Uncharacterized protein n=1 Tax=Letharia columbiana TaxID=112416 RepID=A0A8H6CJT3_9LECA|nr:uncharacterized protein HO173_012906 [Letharia columbiana]KAF6224665.1 hypothetical protein HO173_012906 [Letharia columbiana]
MSPSPQNSNNDEEGRNAASKTPYLYLTDSYAPPETKLHPRASSASTQGLKKDKRKATSRQRILDGATMHTRSMSIKGDDNGATMRTRSKSIKDNPTSRADHNRSVSRGRTATRRRSVGLNSASTAHGPGKGEMSDPSVASILRPRPLPKQAAERDTLHMPPSSDLGKKRGGVGSPSGPGISGNINWSHRNRLGHLRGSGGPPTFGNDYNSKTTGTQGLSSIFGLIAVAVTLAYMTGCESPSVGIQKSWDLVLQAGAGVTSAYIWALCATQQLYQRLPPVRAAPRYSSGERLSVALGQTYTDLSQALAASDSLYQAPALISQRRSEALRFRLPEGSLTRKPLQLFLRQTVHIDEDLLRLILYLGQISTLTLRQQQETTDTLRFIQRVEYFGTFQMLRVRVVGVSTQESQLKTRLEEHFRYLNESIRVAQKAAHQVLQQYVTLASTTEAIRQSSLGDEQRFLFIKSEAASQLGWVKKTSVQLFGLAEPEDLVEISQNVELARGIHNWTQNVVDSLQRVTLHLSYAKANIGLLVEDHQPQ